MRHLGHPASSVSFYGALCAYLKPCGHHLFPGPVEPLCALSHLWPFALITFHLSYDLLCIASRSPVSNVIGLPWWYIPEPAQRVWNTHLFVRITCAHHLHCHTNGTWGYLWVSAKTTMVPAASADGSSDTNVWMLANFLKCNSDNTALFQKSPLHRETDELLHPAWFLESFPDFLISESPSTLSFLVGRIWNELLFAWSSSRRCLKCKCKNWNEMQHHGHVLAPLTPASECELTYRSSPPALLRVFCHHLGDDTLSASSLIDCSSFSAIVAFSCHSFPWTRNLHHWFLHLSLFFFFFLFFWERDRKRTREREGQKERESFCCCCHSFIYLFLGEVPVRWRETER